MRATRFEAFGDPSVLKVVEVPAPTADEKGRVGAGDRGFDQSERREERRRGDEPDKSAAHPGRRGRGWSGRVDRRGSLGYERRYRLYPRRDPRRADRRAGREPAPQAQNSKLSNRP